MKTIPLKLVGFGLISADCALLAWVLYDPSDIVSVLRLGGVVSEAVVALAALTVVALGFVCGAALFVVSRRRTHVRIA